MLSVTPIVVSNVRQHEDDRRAEFFLKREQIDDYVIQKLELAGVMSIRHCACLLPDQEAMRKLAKVSLGYGDDDLARAAKVVRLLCAWDVAKMRTSEVNNMDAENEVRGQPKTISSNDLVGMKEAFEKQFWQLSDQKTPGKSCLEKRLESLERKEFRAEKLCDVINYREDDAVELRPVWDQKGSLTSMKAASSVPLPADSEGLRARLPLLGTAWVMASYMHTANPLVKGIHSFVFTEYADYLLGKHVWGLTAKGSDERQIAQPSCTLLLKYEHEIRAQAYSGVQTRHTGLEEALPSAWCDQTVRSGYFVSPLALEHLKRPACDIASETRPATERKKGKGKPKGVGKGKSKDKPESCAPVTPEGQRICFDLFQQQRAELSTWSEVQIC